jgi:hypothetical protein
MPLASGNELAVALFGTASGNASTGGTITLATGAHGYVTSLAGSTTAITTATGFDGIGCAGKIAGSVPVNCYGLWGRRQLGAGSARNYGVASEGLGLFQYDSNVAKGGFDVEDNGGTARACFFVDSTGAPGARGILNLQAVSTDGLKLLSSDAANAITIVSGSTTTNKPTRFGADITPSSAAGAFNGSTSLPWAGITYGNAASNTVSFAGTFTANRTATMPDATGNVAVDSSSTYNPANGIFSGAWQSTNITPVTVTANVSTDQNLMTATIPAGTLNRVGRTLRIWLAGVYSTPAASTTAVVIKVKIGALTMATWTSTALAGIQATNDQFNVSASFTTQTAGATAAFENHGNMIIDLGVGNAVADSVFADVNTATVSSLDTTASQTLQVTIAFTVASASNSATQRQLIVETMN